MKIADVNETTAKAAPEYLDCKQIAERTGRPVKEVLEDAAGLRLVENRDGEADMDEHIGADPGLGRIGKVDLLDDAAEIDPRDAHDGRH